MKTPQKRQKKSGDYVKFEIRLEPLTKELLFLAAQNQGESLTKYIADAAFERMTREVKHEA